MRIYLSNAYSRATPGHHGDSLTVAGMARPRWFEVGAGICSALAPDDRDLRIMQVAASSYQSGLIDEAAYLRELRRYRRAVERLMDDRLERGLLAPGRLAYAPKGSPALSPLPDSVTVLCGCARWEPGKERRHPCHLELVAPRLHKAARARTSDVALDRYQVVLWGMDYDPSQHTPELFGWPSLED